MAPDRHFAYLGILLVAGALLFASGCVTEEPATMSVSELTFYTEQLPPYNYEENGTLKGLAVDLLEEMTAKMGEPVSHDQINLVYWTEGYQAALTGDKTVVFTTARLPQREQSFKWAGPIYPFTTALFARPDHPATIEFPDELEGVRIGVIKDDVAMLQLLEAGVEPDQLVQETDATVLVEKLLDGEIDFWAYPEVAGKYFTYLVTGNPYSLRVVSTLPELEGYYAFSTDVPDSLVESFQQALDDLKAEKDAGGISTYEKILGRHIPAVGLSQLTYLAEEWAPYNYEEDGEVTGISVDILHAVFGHMVMDQPPEVSIVPLPEGFEAVQDGGTVLFPLVRTAEREPLYKWAGPFTKASFVVFAPMEKNLVISSPEDLNLYRIGVVEESVENGMLISRGVDPSQIVNRGTSKELVGMLEAGEIDLWAMGDLAGRHQMLKTAADPNAYEVVYTLSEDDLYFIFSQDVPDQLVEAFQRGLETVRDQRDATGVSEYERILYHYLGVGCARQEISDAEVMALVNMTAADIAKDPEGTFQAINAQEAPYWDPENPALYVFVYDSDVTMVAHGDNIRMVGENYRYKTDVTGKPFRFEILLGARENTTGWIDYVYVNPVEQNLYYKTTYYRLVEGSDGNEYVVCSGNFKACGA
ncbi:MAG: transporter substrate-binding domain-containing protein [Methanomicrobiaceae archaeon]|nr:transporter substrate-binding domain-containing protein [Methanomicrobiaceae archaeon]